MSRQCMYDIQPTKCRGLVSQLVPANTETICDRGQVPGEPQQPDQRTPAGRPSRRDQTSVPVEFWRALWVSALPGSPVSQQQSSAVLAAIYRPPGTRLRMVRTCLLQSTVGVIPFPMAREIWGGGRQKKYEIAGKNTMLRVFGTCL